MSTAVEQDAISLEALLAMGQSGDVARFIHLATAALMQGTENDELRLLLMRRLAERGLLYRAKAFGAGLSPELRSHAQFDEMMSSLTASAAGDGYTPWHRQSTQFDANMAGLRQHYDCADEVAATWAKERRHLELHMTTDGLWQVYDRRDGPMGGWRPAFGDHRPEPSAEELAEQFQGRVLTPLAIEGVGLGYHLPWLHAATADTSVGANALIYQIEPSLLALAVALHLNDWRGLLADRRVRLCCGPSAYEQFERAVEAEVNNVPPAVVVQATPWDPGAVGRAHACIQRMAAQEESRRVALQESAGLMYQGRDGAWWCHRYKEARSGEGPPLRVFGITCRFTTVLKYAMRDAFNALDNIGCQTRLLVEPDDHSRIPAHQWLSAILDFEPDLVLLIDHTRRRQQGGLIDDLPLVTWVQDRLPWLYQESTGESLGPLDFCMGLGRDELVQRFNYPGERFLACAMATDPAALFPPEGAASSEGEDARFACDVAYATNFNKTPAEFHTHFRRRTIGTARKVVDAAYEELVRLAGDCELNGGLWFGQFIERIERAVGEELSPADRADLAGEFAQPMTDRLLRHQTIEWAADWAEKTGRRLHLYGHGWDSYPRFSKYARGFVQHGPELGRAFRDAKVHLHAGCAFATHQRVLDGLAAGGFFLVRLHADDVSHLVPHAMYELACRQGLRPGMKVYGRDLPPPLDEEHARQARRRGYDPDAPMELDADRIDRMRRYHESGAAASAAERWPVADVAARLWPEFERITFEGQQDLATLLEWSMNHEDERRAIAASMRARMLETFGYESLMRKMLDWLEERLGRAS